MTTERAYEIAFEVVDYLREEDFNYEYVMEISELAENIERAAFFQRMIFIRFYYDLLSDIANTTQDSERLARVNELLDMLDEWEEVA